MIISRIVLKNWRNFQSVDVELRRRIFLIGANASGKSNFLDAFRFLRDLTKPGGGLQKAVAERGGVSKIRCFAARREPQVEIEVYLKENYEEGTKWKYSLGILQGVRGSIQSQPYIQYERVYRVDEDREILNRPLQGDKEDEERLTETHLEQKIANTHFREIAKFFESITYYHLIPQLIRYPDVFTGPSIEDDPFGRTFLEKLAKTPEKTRSSRLGNIEKALRLAVPQLKELETKKDVRGTTHLEAVYAHWRPGAGKQNEQEFSDGTLRLIGFLWSILEGDPLLLLEEPELSLHPAIVRQIPSLIWRLQSKKKTQIILSTHSPDLLSSTEIPPEEVLILTPGKEGTIIEQANSIEEVRLLVEGGMNIGDATLPRTEPKEIRRIRQLNFFNE